MPGNTESIPGDRDDSRSSHKCNSNYAIANEAAEEEKAQVFYRNQCGY